MNLDALTTTTTNRKPPKHSHSYKEIPLPNHWFFRVQQLVFGSIHHLTGKSCFFLPEKGLKTCMLYFKSNLRHAPCHQLSMLKMLRNPGIMACFVSICLYHLSEFQKYACNKVEHYYLGTVGCYACGMVVVPVSVPFGFQYSTFHW